MYYNKIGIQITVDEWNRLFEKDSYRNLSYSEGDTWSVSTLWLGLEHGNDIKGRALIFETLSYHPDGRKSMVRYATEKEAKEGHENIVKEMLLIPNPNLEKISKRKKNRIRQSKITVKKTTDDRFSKMIDEDVL